MSSKKINVGLILELSEAGATRTETARQAGCSPRTVGNVRRAHGFQSPQFLSTEQLARIEEKLDDGWSMAEIHRTLGHDPETIARHFPGKGWTREQMNEFNATLRQAREGLRKAA